MARSNSVAKAFLIASGGKLLMLRRSATDRLLPGKLDLAGGWLDEGEEPVEGLLREIKEEAGIDLTADDVKLGYTSSNTFLGPKTTCYLFVGKLPEKFEVTLSYEHDAWFLLTLEEVLARYDHPVWLAGLNELIKQDLIK